MINLHLLILIYKLLTCVSNLFLAFKVLLIFFHRKGPCPLPFPSLRSHYVTMPEGVFTEAIKNVKLFVVNAFINRAGTDSDYRNVRTCEPGKILLVKNRGNIG